MRDVSRTELENVIDEWIIGRNAERNREILKRRMIDRICYEPLAEEFELSVTQIKSIIYKGQEKIFRHLKTE